MDEYRKSQADRWASAQRDRPSQPPPAPVAAAPPRSTYQALPNPWAGTTASSSVVQLSDEGPARTRASQATTAQIQDLGYTQIEIPAEDLQVRLGFLRSLL